MLDAVGELQSIAILALKIVPPQNKVKQTFVIGNVSYSLLSFGHGLIDKIRQYKAQTSISLYDLHISQKSS